MSGAVLIVNSGSSSIKFAVFTAGVEPAALLRGSIDRLGTAPQFRASDAKGHALAGDPLAGAPADLPTQEVIDRLYRWIGEQCPDVHVVAAGHRVVYGGDEFRAPVRTDPAVLERLETLVPFARLHQPHNLNAIRALSQLRPGLPQVACFDTTFHLVQPAVARAYALPRELSAAGIKRYGFHGLSYQSIADALPHTLGGTADARIVVAHLGNGASLCAMRERRSIATTMGFTVIDGLVMGTRCGSLDPGVVIHLIREHRMTVDEVDDLLYRRCGLLGVSGVSADMRELLASASPHAREAVELFVYRAVREIGSLAAALGGLDALVFTGGIGEHAAPVRQMICEQCGWLGVELDAEANNRHASRISTSGSRASAWTIPTDEELVIARETNRLLAAHP